MPDGRSIGTPRDSINRSGGTIGSSNGLSTRTPIGGNRTVASGVTTTPQGNAPSQAEIDRINDLIRRNVTQYIDVPWNEAFVGRLNPVANIPGDTGPTLPRNPFEVLADALSRNFGGSVYNPPLTQQSYGYGSTGGVNWTLLIIVGVIGVGAYFYFNR